MLCQDYTSTSHITCCLLVAFQKKKLKSISCPWFARIPSESNAADERRRRGQERSYASAHAMPVPPSQGWSDYCCGYHPRGSPRLSPGTCSLVCGFGRHTQSNCARRLCGPITVFADDHLGAWTFHTMEDIVAMEQQVILLFKVLSEAGLSLSPSKSKLVVQVKGAAAAAHLAKRTIHLQGKPHWCFGEGDAMVAVPIVKDFIYLGTVVTLGRPSDRTVTHRLAEARGPEGQLRKCIRSRSVLRSGTRVAIWRACVVASAFYGLLAHKLTAANVTSLCQWYHRSLRAVTGMPAHLTHVSNADLRTKFGLTEPLAALLQLTRNKLR